MGIRFAIAQNGGYLLHESYHYQLVKVIDYPEQLLFKITLNDDTTDYNIAMESNLDFGFLYE